MFWLCTTWEINWSAIAALLTGASALAAAWAAWEARGAAKAAIRVDQNAAARIADREQRDSIPLAVAIQRELVVIYGLMHDLPELERGRQAEHLGAIEFLRQLAATHVRFKATTLEAAMLDLGCFDAAVGRALGTALASTQGFYNVINIPGVPPSNDQCIRVINVIMQQSQRYAPPILAAVVALSHVTGIEAV